MKKINNKYNQKTKKYKFYKMKLKNTAKILFFMKIK